MKIGYVGLGALGSELARRFLQAHSLTVWDLNPAATKTFEALGARVAPSAAQLARDSDVVLLCLPRSSDVRELLFGAGQMAEGLARGKLVIDQTSGVPGETREIAQQLAQRGVEMLDAAVSASPHIVSQGSAVLMASAPDAVYERALPILRTITQTIYRCGTRVGDGQAMKMVNNAMNAANRLGTLEIVAMGRTMGLSLECMADALNKGSARNQTTEKMLPALVQGKASTNFALSLMLKDVNQAVALGMDLGTPMPICNVVRGLLQIGLNTLGANAKLEDMVGVIESMAGTRLASPGGRADTRRSDASVPDTKALKVGYVGVGAMGGAVARRLMVSRTLHIFDTRPEVVRELAAEGAIACADLVSLARACDIIMLCLPTSSVVRQVIFGNGGLAEALASGKIVVDQTTGDPAATRAIAADLAKVGVQFVDAPVSGGPSGAAAGTVAIMCGGSADATRQVRPLLESISPNILDCGESGNGHLAKVVNNAVSSLCRLVTYECVAAGFKYGLSLDDMNDVLNKSSGWSGASRKILPALGSKQSTANLALELKVKDLSLAAQLSMSGGAPMMISSVVRSLYEAGANQLGGAANVDEMTHLYEAMAAVKFDAGAHLRIEYQSCEHGDDSMKVSSLWHVVGVVTLALLRQRQ